MKLRFTPVLILAVVASVFDADARTWTSHDGNFTTEAELVGFEEGNVLLRKTETITVPLAKLSDADHRYLRAYAARPSKAASSPGSRVRTWTSSDGKFATQAELVSANAETVRLRKISPQLTTVPLERLSQTDQRYVMAQPAPSGPDAEQSPDGSSTAEAQVPAAGPSGRQTCTLELKRLEPLDLSRSSRSPPPADNILRRVSPQHFLMRVGMGGSDSGARAFARVVKKEPDKYQAEHPFRGVATLGSQQYAFVLDSLPSAADVPAAANSGPTPPKPKGYGRLYFDLNQNGDLMDDKVIEAVGGVQPQSTRSSSYSHHQFPRVDLTIEAAGAGVDYAFFFSVYSQTSSSYTYASASLLAAAYRQGWITTEGKRRRIVLLDFNSNGRFDDEIKVRQSSSRVYVTTGDTLLVDPDPRNPKDRYAGNVPGQQLSKLVNIAGRFYDLNVSPAGDELTLMPCSLPVGYVTHRDEGLRAVVYGDKGVMSISGGESQPAPLPEGGWKLASYTIYHTGARKPPSGSANLRIHPSALQRPSYALVSAQAAKDCKPIEVRGGETVALPFGPPYRPVVKAYSVAAGQTARLGMSLIGSGGETCTDLRINGNRPEKPEFTITGQDGEEVERGKFDWG